jgi:glutamine synthetase
MAEYVWIDAQSELRSKTMTLDARPTSVEELREWNFDGSSTGQAPGDNSDVYLRPVKFWKDPFRLGDNIIVMCECWNADGTPNKFNFRHEAAKYSEKHTQHETWFGIEQEYTLMDEAGKPFGWPNGGFPGPQGPYYCGVGAGKVIMRDLIEAHYKACLYCEVPISGINAEVMPSQWEFQVGPATGIDAGDQMWFARFLLVRIAEEFGVVVSYAAKPLAGDWNGAGAHTNVSTKEMREEGGMKHIISAIEKLSKRHIEHIKCYGDDNSQRLTGRHETGSIDKFDYGVANRGCSVRIPRSVDREGKGYFEDRRPAASMDPYRVVGKMLETLFE